MTSTRSAWRSGPTKRLLHVRKILFQKPDSEKQADWLDEGKKKDSRLQEKKE